MNKRISNIILKLIKDKKLSNDDLLKKLSKYHESDIADSIELLDTEERIQFLQKLPIEYLGEILTYIDNPEDYLEKMSVEKAADVVETMDADDAVDVLEEVSDEVLQDILEEMDSEQREDIELIQNFSDDEIGSKITTNFITVNKRFSIKETMKSLVEQAPENDNIQNIFVLEDDYQYYGTIVLKDLIIAREGTSLEDITRTEYPRLYAHDKIDDIINEIKDIDLDIIPVLAENNTILGVITSQDIIETVNEELNEDYLKFALVDEDSDIDDNIFVSVIKRFPWLSLLLLVSTVSSFILSGFDHVFATIPALVLFQSWVLDTSGNAGTQSLALCIRSITDDELKGKKYAKYFFKELLTGLLDGLIVGICGFIISFIFLIISKNFITDSGNIYTQLKAGLAVGVAILIAIPVTTILGLLIPSLFKKLHIDPAVASGPLITTIADMGGVAVYYFIAGLFFNLI